MANPADTFNIASKKISEWEGGSQYHNPETDMWTAYDDVVGGNIPTVHAGITGQIGGEDIQIGQQYPGSLLGQEFQGRMQGDYDWLSQNLGDSWGSLNPNQQAATMSLVHNVGATAFSQSDAFRHLKGGSSVNPNWLEDFAFEAFDPNEGFVRGGEIDPETNRKKIIPGLQNRRNYEKEKRRWKSCRRRFCTEKRKTNACNRHTISWYYIISSIK